MTTTNNQSGLYILRILIVIVAFVGVPFFPFLFLGRVAEHYHWIALLWIPFGFWVWSRLSRRLLVESRYSCPNCDKSIARIEVVEREGGGAVYLTCPGCGFREKSEVVAWHPPSG
jgi:predicted RNA-binding Zn-ribbon protein involved in translation (DUF1610 family)